MSPINKILVLFKTHLDVGFTDFAGTVLQKYREEYIPGALRTARQLRESGTTERLIWTTGSFLIWDYLQTADENARREMENAIRAGDISWHGLPCTTHTELLNESLFAYGLSLSQDLDARFGRKTIGAKMTDVPGHTAAMIPALAKAGIQFLHIGVNPASTVPDVPEVFLWQFEDKEIVVMYNHGYGDFTMIPGTGTAVYFAHTGDNHGPQSAEDIRRVYQELSEQYPDAELCAADLNILAQEVLKIKETLPVFTKEIGDTWIHGVGSDPWKVRQFRELLRQEPEWSEGERAAAFRKLLLVPEHTWGMDIKTHLADHDHYIRSEFEQVRKTAPNYQKVESSWEEQRDYVRQAMKVLSAKHQKEMMEFANDADSDTADFVPVSENGEFTVAGWNFSFDADGSLRKLLRNGKIYADDSHHWGKIMYENYSPEDYRQFYHAYIVWDVEWAREDFGKIGMEKAIAERIQATPILKRLLRRENEFLVQMEMEGPAYELYGAPSKWEWRIRFEEKQIFFTLRWMEKPACRVPEAVWCGFCPAEKVENAQVRKLGHWIDPQNVCNGGGLHLHATDYGVKWTKGSLETLDTALVSVGDPKVVPYTREPIHPEEGFWFNLENNIWGTNFVMWYGEDASFRWVFREDNDA